MNNYNYNEGKTSLQIKAIKLFKKWFDCEGICQFKYTCNRKTNYFIKYPVYTDDDGISTLDINIDECQEGKFTGKINRKALGDIDIDYYIDFVCVHKGNPLYGFIIVDNDTYIYIYICDLEMIGRRLDRYGNFELYVVYAEWIISQTIKPDNIDCRKIC